jgi:glucose/arabinose dehydrogenase
MKKLLLPLLLFPVLLFGQNDLSLNLLADGYNRPCEIVNAGDERLFIVQQPGIIEILLPDGTQINDPFLDIQSAVQDGGFEQGLLGLAFAPDYCTSGEFYVNYTTTFGGTTYTRVSRFAVNPDNENDALEDSEEIILEFEQDFNNHNGGQLLFGPDGYLYIATGDGGSGGDPFNRAQDIMSHLGKILRIDVSTDPYSIPDSNPFAFDDFGLDEIWAYGLRNPWKITFDPETGDLYIADVGQSDWEEVNFQPANSDGGENYGWRCYEGTEEYNTSGNCSDITGTVFPVLEYNHTNVGNGQRCSVTGGMVYRGSSFPSLEGRYILSDYCSGEYWVLWEAFGEWQSFLGDELESTLVSFGTDVWGELYALNGSEGTVSQVVEGGGEFLDHIQFDGGTTLQSLLSGASYTWFLNGEALEGLNSQTIEIDQIGTYSLEITTETGCVINTSDIEVEALSTFDQNLVESFQVFPNPATSQVFVKIELVSAQGKRMELEIFDAIGRQVAGKSVNESGTTDFSLDQLNRGLYTVVLRTTEGLPLARQKLILN